MGTFLPLQLRGVSTFLVCAQIVCLSLRTHGLSFQDKLLVRPKSGVMTSPLAGKQLALTFTPPWSGERHAALTSLQELCFSSVSCKFTPPAMAKCDCKRHVIVSGLFSPPKWINVSKQHYKIITFIQVLISGFCNFPHHFVVVITHSGRLGFHTLAAAQIL